ncbi:GtrA family protein [Lacticaseibacillus jixiensis]|uniref:GtrA family protein n=1 Tax=Lacticaseibacillus jixiensis TaxID=3231926 RepID=UPI0036F21B10
MQEFKRTLKYFCCASSAAVVEMGSFTILTQATTMAYAPRYLIALVLSVVWNFTLNRHFTFHSDGNIPKAMLKVAAYYAVFTPLSAWFGDWATASGVNDYVATLVNLAANGITEFLYQRFFVFGATLDRTVRVHRG